MESFSEAITIEKLDNRNEIRILIECEPNEDEGFLFIRVSFYQYNGVKMNRIYELFTERIFGEYSQSEAILIAKLRLINYLAHIQKKVASKEN